MAAVAGVRRGIRFGLPADRATTRDTDPKTTVTEPNAPADRDRPFATAAVSPPLTATSRSGRRNVGLPAVRDRERVSRLRSIRLGTPSAGRRTSPRASRRLQCVVDVPTARRVVAATRLAGEAKITGTCGARPNVIGRSDRPRSRSAARSAKRGSDASGSCVRASSSSDSAAVSRIAPKSARGQVDRIALVDPARKRCCREIRRG